MMSLAIFCRKSYPVSERTSDHKREIFISEGRVEIDILLLFNSKQIRSSLNLLKTVRYCFALSFDSCVLPAFLSSQCINVVCSMFVFNQLSKIPYLGHLLNPKHKQIFPTQHFHLSSNHERCPTLFERNKG